jgi:adenosylcobinamide-GDP ribazoletransferase
MINGLITAIRTLSIIPIIGKDAEDFSSSIIWFPFVGFLLGGALFLFIKISLFFTDQYKIIALISVFLSAVLTRAIHLDGLADFADGFFGGYTKEKILLIMKDSNIGTFGALALIFVVFLKWLGLLYLIENRHYDLIVPIYVASRFVMSDLSVRLRYARDNGTGRPFVKNAKLKHLIGALFFAIILSLPFGVIGLAILLIGYIMSLMLGFYFVKKIGGITGDLLGASCEISETVLLILSIFIVPHIHNTGIFL